MTMLAKSVAQLSLLASLGLGALPAQARLQLHVPSPDWRDQIIYFVLTDRFADGDPSNNDQGAGEFRPGSEGHYNGGDLRGLRQRLDYIRGLGASALWITPPVANQWQNPPQTYTGYHGYWASHFKQVDKHLGSLRDYQRLSDALHRRGMYLVQDVVLNHSGDYFAYPKVVDPNQATLGYQLHRQNPHAPAQWPFNHNDPRRAKDRQLNIYHWRADVADYGVREQELNQQMGGLDDLNTESPLVRKTLRDSYGYWLRQVGVDAFRVDTAFYVPQDYLRDFMYAADPKAPGMAKVARASGRNNFLAFGEGFGIDRSGRDEQMRKIESYMHDAKGQPVLPSMVQFPLYGSLGDVFARGAPSAVLAERIKRSVAVHPNLHLMPSFIDNHDVSRFLAGGSQAALQQSLLAIMTLPGIPTIYYGTEQGFTEPRAAMFKGGFAANGRDHYDVEAPLYRVIASMSKLRRSHPLFSRGLPTILQASEVGPGVLAYKMQYAADTAIVLFNTADSPSLVHHLATGLPEASKLKGLFDLTGPVQDVQLNEKGELNLLLPPRAAKVWRLAPGAQQTMASQDASRVSLDAPVRAGAELRLTGHAPAGESLRLVIDGDWDNAQVVQAQADGSWQALLDTRSLDKPELSHRVVAWSEGAGVSNAQTFSFTRDWKLLVDQPDPKNDDHGPSGRYQYPTDASWGDKRQLDLRRIKVFGDGGSLKLELQMNQLTQSWNPQNGFDHVALNVFIEVLGQGAGSSLMPLQNASLPEGMRWHYRLRAHGWSNALFSSEGATAQHEGRPISPAAQIDVNPAQHTLSFTLNSRALGGLKSLSGVKLYINSWDYDAGFRALNPLPQSHSFGGGQSTDPLWMDDSGVIRIP